MKNTIHNDSYRAYLYRRNCFSFLCLFSILSIFSTSAAAEATISKADLNDKYNSLEFHSQTTDSDTEYEIIGNSFGVAANFKLMMHSYPSGTASRRRSLNNLYFRLNYDKNDM